MHRNQSLKVDIIEVYTFWPSFAADSGVIFGKPLRKADAKDQTKSAMNMRKNVSSVAETMPRGPFISTGRFHMLIAGFFELHLIMHKTYMHVISQLSELQFFSGFLKTLSPPSHRFSIVEKLNILLK